MAERRELDNNLASNNIRGPEALRLFLKTLREEGFLIMYPGKNPKEDAHNLALKLAEKRVFRGSDIGDFENHLLRFLEDDPDLG